MKKILALGVVASTILSSVSVSASDMMVHMGTSLSTDTNTMMTKSSHMNMETSMTIGVNRWPVSRVAKELGYNWGKDRKHLAKLAGIDSYRGTLKQNLMVKNYLLSVWKDSVMVGGASMIRSRDIVDNAVLANNVTTVVAAVKAAGLVDTLKGVGPFTVFAPTNSAFEKLPAGTVETLLKPENKDKLVDILTYHVVAGSYTSAQITDGLTLKTVEGKMLTFKKDASGKIWINGSSMVETKDVISTNGVTHIIDTVLLPQQ